MAATTIETSQNIGGERPASDRARSQKASPTGKRLYWRAVVRTGGHVSGSRERDRVEWHLADCATLDADSGHCTEGRHLVETIGHPDGHCIIDGVCGLCGAEPPRD